MLVAGVRESKAHRGVCEGNADHECAPSAYGEVDGVMGEADIRPRTERRTVGQATGNEGAVPVRKTNEEADGADSRSCCDFPVYRCTLHLSVALLHTSSPGLDLLPVSTDFFTAHASASTTLFTSLFGWTSVIPYRSIIAVYFLFLWVTFSLLVTPGYITRREYPLNLQGKPNFMGSEDFDVDARRRDDSFVTSTPIPFPHSL
ncbi:hypothetical protein C8R45DRAFT_1100532 [Mycena sanguinolenta]|nr:hypothetical protein C8R45DRAFT_1100532 [Mycena sanguinolenta]